MSYTEAPRKTIDRFSQSWTKTNPNSLLSEFVSISKETNREPDSYHFIVGENSLIDPDTSRPILNFITEGIEKDIARKLQKWALENDEGIALWESPRQEGVYPCPKIIIHRIAYDQSGQKVVLNSAILFDPEIKNPDYKRKTLYILPDSEDNIFKILNWVKRVSTEKANFEGSGKTAYSQAQYFAEQIRMGIPSQTVINAMQRTGFLGQSSISCPTFSGLVDNRANIVVFGGKFIEKCGNCSATLRKLMKAKDKCPYCGGVYEGC